MTTGKLDLAVPQGTTLSKQLTYRIDGTPVNLTGYTARLVVRVKQSSTSSLLTLTNSAGLTLGGAAGTIAITISATQTAALPAGGLFYFLEITSGGGIVTRLVAGQLEVSK